MINCKVIEAEDIKNQINRGVLITDDQIDSENYMKNGKTPIERFLLDACAFYKYPWLVIYSVKHFMDTAKYVFEWTSEDLFSPSVLFEEQGNC